VERLKDATNLDQSMMLLNTNLNRAKQGMESGVEMNARKREREKKSTYFLLNLLAGSFPSPETIAISGWLCESVLVGGSPVPGNIVEMQSPIKFPPLAIFSSEQ